MATESRAEGVTRGQRRREQTARAILDAAEAAFKERGFVAARMEEVSEAADVAIGSIYHHFGNKEGLFLAVVERALEVNERYMVQAYEGPGTALERLLAASAAYLKFSAEHPFYFRTIALPQYERSAHAATLEAAGRIADRVERLVGMLEQLVGEARDGGELRDCDPHLVARFCWAAWNGVIGTQLRPDRLRLGPSEVQAVLNEGLRILLQGLVT